jgi:hypothetical protein
MDREGSAPPATGRRVEWGAAPAWLREEVEARLGARVAGAVTQVGGFSPGVAARLRLVDGRRVFVKAVGPEPNLDSPAAHRAEARNMALLPRSAPAPRLLWSLDRRGWVALVFEDVDGAQPALPCRAGQEAGWPRAAEGETLLHSDLRADNLLLTPTRVVAVDWPWACVGAAWVDLLLLLPSVTMQGGPDPEVIFATHPAAAGADPRAVASALAAWAGFLVGGARLPAPPGLPTLRAFQLGQGVVALDWLRRRTGWS